MSVSKRIGQVVFVMHGVWLLLRALVALIISWVESLFPQKKFTSQDQPPQVVIVGAGMAGILMGIKLKELGIPYIILEKNAGLGGTWLQNTYPGCACDINAFMYSFSFEQRPDWSSGWPSQAELLKYMQDVAKKYGLEPYIHCNTYVKEAAYNAATHQWRVVTNRGTLLTDVLVSAVGQLNVPSYPDIPGLRSFKGDLFHAGAWNHEVDLTHKRVAVIGAAASAVQLVPEVANIADKLYVFQRSASYVLQEKDERPYSPFVQAIFRYVPLVQRVYRWYHYLGNERLFPFLFRDSAAAESITKWFMDGMKAAIHKPELVPKLMPKHPIGCKRILIASKYYPALHRDHVSLITDPITEIHANGVRTATDDYKVDAIVLATGYKSHDFLGTMKVVGKSGQTLSEFWHGTAKAHLGITVPDFPNLFIMYGPNTNLGHNSIIFMLEAQAQYITSVLSAMTKRKLAEVSVKTEVFNTYQEEVQRRLAPMVWTSGCSSWYVNAQGFIDNNLAMSTIEYWLRTRSWTPQEFQQLPGDRHPPLLELKKDAEERKLRK